MKANKMKLCWCNRVKDQTIIGLYCFWIKHPALHGRSDCL